MPTSNSHQQASSSDVGRFHQRKWLNLISVLCIHVKLMFNIISFNFYWTNLLYILVLDQNRTNRYHYNASVFKVERLWTPYNFGLHPAVITTPVPDQEHISLFLPPPCGLTQCDNTDIISGYNNNWQLRTPKCIRYRIVNLSDDDGGNPTVTLSQIQVQHQVLNEAFRPYNITLDLSVHNVRNSSLRRTFILSNCRIGKIGNRQCDPECDHPRTGHDGGDCLRMGHCYNWKRQDGVCNPECNSIYYDYDDGDCCDPDVTDVLKTCFDPESPER